MKRYLTPFWLDIAYKELGVKEIPGLEHNPRILEYFKTLPAKWSDILTSDEDAWCSAGMNAVMEWTGIPGTDDPTAQSWLKWGQTFNEPRYGCVVIIKRGTEAWQGHVGFVVDENESEILVLGGNQNNSWSEKWYPKALVLGYRWPLALQNIKSLPRRVREYRQPVLERKNLPEDTKLPIKWYHTINWQSVGKNAILVIGGLLCLHPSTAAIGSGILGFLNLQRGAKKETEKGSILDLIKRILEAILEVFKKK